MSTTIQNTLTKIESMLATLVGGRATKKMGPTEFVHYAHAQIAKAMAEPEGESTRRLKALHASVAVFKDNFTNDEATVDVPIYVNDVTSLDEKSSKMISPVDAANLNPDDESAFEQGFVAKFAALREQFDTIIKESADPDDEEKRKAAKPTEDEEAPDSEDEAKRKRFPPGTKAPPFTPKKPSPPKKPGTDDDEEKRAATKGADVSKDGTKWPSDLNDPAFVKDGKVEKSLEWGPDPES